MKKQKIKPECKLVIAGPGAGKTHNMVSKVLECLNTLQANRFCAVITYTNAATDEIKKRLTQKGNIPANVFVGTTHSFLNQFIFSPFAKLLGIVNDDYVLIDSAKIELHENSGQVGKHAFKKINGLDAKKSTELFDELISKKWLSQKGNINKKFTKFITSLALNTKFSNIEAEIIKVIVSCIDNKTDRRKNEQQLAIWKAGDLIQYGFITYDKVLEKSHEIVHNNPKILNIISSRLQYIFVDEYQDISNWQHEIFKKIYKEDKTNLYCIGDPLQSIFKFSYANSKQKAPSFDNCPIYDLQKNYSKEEIKDNNRSQEAIVEFINFYTEQIGLKQIPKQNITKRPIFFITDKQDMLNTFLKLAETYRATFIDEEYSFLILAEEWDTIGENPIFKMKNVIKKAKNNSNQSSQYKEISRCILSIVGYKKSEIVKNKESNIEELRFRRFCLQVLKQLYTKPENDRIEFIKTKFLIEYKLSPKFETSSSIEISKSLNDISTLPKSELKEKSSVFYSSIHSAKGLEATSVLVVAKTQNELKKWLDYEKIKDNSDTYRFGYVAFSRAKELLCIACLEDLEETYKSEIIKKFGFETYPKGEQLL